jgi:peptidoglycan hydrolase CwlO-like protein
MPPKLSDIHEDIKEIKENINKILDKVNNHECFINQIKGGLKVITGSGIVLIIAEIIKYAIH